MYTLSSSKKPKYSNSIKRRNTELPKKMSQNKTHFNAGETIYTLHDLPQDMISQIIGRGGSTIKKLQRGLNPNIRFDFTSNKETKTADAMIFVNSRGRGVTIADADKARDAFLGLISDIEEEQRKYDHKILEQRWKLTPTQKWAVGRIIGPRGANIKDLLRGSSLTLDIDDAGENAFLQLRPQKRHYKISHEEATNAVNRFEARLKSLLTPKAGAKPRVTYERVTINRAGMNWNMVREIQHPLWNLDDCRC